MAQEIFLKLDGITGESNKKGMEGQIEIFSFNFGASNPHSVSAGTGSGAGKIDIQSVAVTKQLDKASPILFLNCAKGTHIANGVISVRESGGTETPEVYYTITMTGVFIDSISVGGAEGGQGKPQESLSFAATKFEFGYKPQSTDGSLGAEITAGWDLTTNSNT